MSKQRGPVVLVHVLAQFQCDRCGAKCLRMTNANVMTTGQIVAYADAPPGEIVCNTCHRAERDEQERKVKVSRQQRDWQRRKDRATKPRGRRA